MNKQEVKASCDLNLHKILTKTQLEGLKRELKEQLLSDLQEEATNEMYKVAKQLLPQLVLEMKPVIEKECIALIQKKLKRMAIDIKIPPY